MPLKELEPNIRNFLAEEKIKVCFKNIIFTMSQLVKVDKDNSFNNERIKRAQEAANVLYNIDETYYKKLLQITHMYPLDILKDFTPERETAVNLLPRAQSLLGWLLATSQISINRTIYEKMRYSLKLIEAKAKSVKNFEAAERNFELARESERSNKIEQAIIYYEKAFAVFKELLYVNHNYIGLTAYGLGRCYKRLKQDDNAKKYFIEAEHILKVNYKSNNPLLEKLAKDGAPYFESVVKSAIEDFNIIDWQPIVNWLRIRLSNHCSSNEKFDIYEFHHDLQTCWSMVSLELLSHKEYCDTTLKDKQMVKSVFLEPSAKDLVKGLVNDFKFVDKNYRRETIRNREIIAHLEKIKTELIELLQTLNKNSTQTFAFKKQKIFSPSFIVNQMTKELQRLLTLARTESNQSDFEYFETFLNRQIIFWEAIKKSNEEQLEKHALNLNATPQADNTATIEHRLVNAIDTLKKLIELQARYKEIFTTEKTVRFSM